jgi:hypothetical protein
MKRTSRTFKNTRIKRGIKVTKTKRAIKAINKTRKIGGAEVKFVCKRGRTSNDLCIEDFENENNFKFHNVPPDGNCFFHTLELYYKLTENQSRNYNDFRALTITYIIENLEEYQAYGINEMDIISLSDNKAWNNNAGDIVVPAAAAALGVRINLYDLKPGTQRPPIKKRIILHVYPDDSRNMETINILRINSNHFGLLVPN